MTTKLIYKIIHSKTFFVIVGTIILIFLATSSVGALTYQPTQPPPSLIPSGIIADGSDCELDRIADPTNLNFFATWLSPGNDGSDTSNNFDVDYGENRLRLRLNQFFVNCHDQSTTGGYHLQYKQNNLTRITYTNGTAVTNIDSSFSVACASNCGTAGAWGWNIDPFNYIRPAGFTGSGVYQVTIRYTQVYARSNGTFACAENGRNIGGIGPPFSFACAEFESTFSFRVEVDQPACTISNIRPFNDADSEINPGDRIKFDLTVTNGRGLQLGVNGPTADPGHPSDPNWGFLANYLVSGSNYARGPTVSSNSYSTTVTTAAFNGGGGVAMIAPGVQNNVPLNWGLVRPGVVWAPDACTGSFDVEPVPIAPTCSVIASVPANPRAGETFASRIRVFNANSYAINVTGASYSITGAGVTGSNLTGNATGLTATISNPSGVLSSASNIVLTSAVPYTINWTINTTLGSGIVCPPLDVTPPALLSCTIVANPFNFEAGENITISIRVNNPNLIHMGITSVSYSGPLSGDPATPANPTIGPSGFELFDVDLVPPDTPPPPGQYDITWDIANSLAANCSGVTTINITGSSYFRFYGGDVLSCGMGFVRGKSDGSYSAGTYFGSASELAIFAMDEINGVMTGSQATGRSSEWDLSFANTSGTIPPQFGGNFGTCPGSFALPTPTLTDAANRNNLNSETTGVYRNTSGNLQASIIDRGQRIVLTSASHLHIKGNITYQMGWTDVTDIPSFTLIVDGNLYIEGGPNAATAVTQLDGNYIVSGDIFTCAGAGGPTENLIDGTDPQDANYIVTRCNQPLKINGTLSADKIHFLRAVGSVNAGSFRELFSSNNVAEAIRFSPEAFLTEGGGLPEIPSARPKLDSIVARPPSF